MKVSLVDVDLWRISPDYNQARFFVVSVDQHVAQLKSPVLLEVPYAADSVIVMERLNGEWHKATTSAGPTTKIEINHFSDTVFGVVDLPGKDGDWAKKPKTCKELYHPPGTAELQDLKTIPGADAFFGTDEVVNQRGDDYWKKQCEEMKSMLQEFKTKENMDIPRLIDGRVSSGFVPQTVDKSKPSIEETGLYLYKADVPSTMNSRLWKATEKSLVNVERRILDQVQRQGPLSPAQVLKICIQENGNNVPLGVLAAHNYLKEIAYQGREAHQDYFCDLIEDEKITVQTYPNSPERQEKMRQFRSKVTRSAFRKKHEQMGQAGGSSQALASHTAGRKRLLRQDGTELSYFRGDDGPGAWRKDAWFGCHQRRELLAIG